MSYASQQDLIDRFGEEEIVQRTDRDGAGVPDPAALNRALADADTLIDGYVGQRYRLPLDPVPALVKSIACDVARYRLYTIDATELVRNNYLDAVKRLEAIQAGRIILDVAGVEAAPADAGDDVLLEAPPRTFSRDTLGGF